MPNANVNGGSIYYELVGAGTPVVLLHGGLLNLRQWDDQVPSIAASHRVVLYDARGYGRSPLGEVEYAHYQDLRGIMDTLGIDRAHLVSLSSGMSAAVEFTLAYPGRVISLVCGAAPLNGYEVGAEFTEGMHGIFAAALADDRSLLRERVWEFAPMKVAATLPAARERLDRMIVEDHGYDYARPGAPRRTRLEPPAARKLHEIDVPTLVILGDGEMPALSAVANHVIHHVAGARLVVIPGAGHFVNIEQPEAYTQTVLEWLQLHAV